MFLHSGFLRDDLYVWFVLLNIVGFCYAGGVAFVLGQVVPLLIALKPPR